MRTTRSSTATSTPTGSPSQLDETTIAWSGSISPDEIAYFRLDGPRLWIENLNAESDTGIHYHTIYRDKELDYGTGVPS